MSSVNKFAPDISPSVAWDILASNPDAILIDVREEIEIKSDGQPDLRSINKNSNLITWRNSLDFSSNNDFVRELKSKFPDMENSTLVFICKAGRRSQMAANSALEAGYKFCLNVESGFEGSINKNGEKNQISGWKFAQLPWEKV